MNMSRRILVLAVVFLLLTVQLRSLPSYGASSVYIPGITNTQTIGQFQGLNIANDGANPNTQLDISVIAAVMVNFSNAPQFASTISKVLNTATTGPNGRRSGLALAANNWYSIYLIGKTDGSSTDVFLDSSLLTVNIFPPTLPAGYSYWLYLGDWYLNSSSNLIQGYQINKVFAYKGAQGNSNYFCCQAWWNTPGGILTSFGWMNSLVPVNRAYKIYGMFSGTGSGWQRGVIAWDTLGTNQAYWSWDEADSGAQWVVPFVYAIKMGSPGLYFAFSTGDSNSYFGWSSDLGFDVGISGFEYP